MVLLCQSRTQATFSTEQFNEVAEIHPLGIVCIVFVSDRIVAGMYHAN